MAVAVVTAASIIPFKAAAAHDRRSKTLSTRPRLMEGLKEKKKEYGGKTEHDSHTREHNEIYHTAQDMMLS